MHSMTPGVFDYNAVKQKVLLILNALIHRYSNALIFKHQILYFQKAMQQSHKTDFYIQHLLLIDYWIMTISICENSFI